MYQELRKRIKRICAADNLVYQVETAQCRKIAPTNEFAKSSPARGLHLAWAVILGCAPRKDAHAGLRMDSHLSLKEQYNLSEIDIWVILCCAMGHPILTEVFVLTHAHVHWQIA